MKNWFQKFLFNQRAKRFTSKKVDERYMLFDVKYLRKAYKYGRDYVKIKAIQYLSEFKTQENYTFLLNEMKVVEDVKLKSYLFESIMNILLVESIIVTDSESIYLNENLDLLDNIGVVNAKPRQSKSTPNVKYLRKAYKYGRDYVKIKAIQYLSEFKTQENYTFLLNEMKVVEDVKLKSYLFESIMNILLVESIVVTDSESIYLNENLDLLDNIGVVNAKPRQSKSTPILFRNNLKNHLEILEEKKKF